MSRAPLTFEGPIIGVRAFRPGRHNTLRSLTTGDHWGPGVHAAHCGRPVRVGDRPHAAPAKRCDCGNYATTTIALARRAVGRSMWGKSIGYGLVIAVLVAASIACAAQPNWWTRAQGAAPLLIAIGTALGYVRERRSIVYAAVLAWGDQVALDVVRGGVQIRSAFMQPIALVSSARADSIAATLGLPTASEKALLAVAREITDGVEIDPSLLARRGPLDWVGWGLWMVALGVLHLGCMAAITIARSIVFAVALCHRGRK
jgi:hypothetical protein